MAKRTKSPINTWSPKDEDIYAESDGKLFIFHFDKFFGKSNLKVYNKFFIKKGSYENQLDIITRYINFFMKFYDKDDELATAYLKIKYALDKEKRFNVDNMNMLINMIYEVLFTDTLREKISAMVEDNYLDDIENNVDKKKYNKKENKHLESLEFTNKHIKILLKISFGMKIISPVLFHYVALNVIKLDKDSDLIYNFYEKLFTIFNDGVDIYNKLFVYVVLASK